MKWLLGAGACAAVICLAGCSQTVPFVAKTPAAAFSETKCPVALGDIRDATAPAHHLDQLLNPNLRPAKALICEYGSVFDQGTGPRHTLAKQIALTASPARKLATAATKIDVGISAGSASCPNDTGNATVIVFDYSNSQPVDLWWHSTGCQTIDNGATEAEQIANDSLGHFQTVFAAVTRPAA